PDLIFRQNFRHYGLNLSAKYVDISSFNADGVTAARDNGYLKAGLVQQTLDNQLEARFATGPIAHTAVAGVDYARYSMTSRFGSYFGDSTAVPDLNLITRNYGQPFIATPPLVDASRQTQDQVGVYLQDQAKFGDFILTLNGRHDWVFQDTYATP
ncbi:TonB-dependent receptor domain-containing protein, partial [Methylobacterium sp. J-076]|uniref:TonB-dependent receptor domain-containing protein n=1 Tax=Methylobacterium sp. J-076 TaxID=2836655 RepID=UPI001FB9429C